jgi:hypothetical protein
MKDIKLLLTYSQLSINSVHLQAKILQATYVHNSSVGFEGRCYITVDLAVGGITLYCVIFKG